MCYQGCRYEHYSGECTLKRDAIPPMDAMCVINDIAAENAELRELVAKMARALGVDSEWCHRECRREFGCDGEPCPLDQALLELGIEVEE